MIGILVALLVSWLLLYLFERKSILALGLLPIGKRGRQFLTGFALTASLCAAVQYAEVQLSEASWVLNEKFSGKLLLEFLFWDFRSVLTEELIFRGALLLILINRLGARRAILISAAAFGIYHWFSFGVLGQVVPMLFVFLGTGLMGYAWAVAFSRTRSMLMPLGLHLGWNFTFNTIFSNGPLGQGLLLTQGGHTISNWFSLVGLLLVPALVLLFVQYFVPAEHDTFGWRKKQEPIPVPNIK